MRTGSFKRLSGPQALQIGTHWTITSGAPTDELKVALRTIWEEIPQEHVNKAVAIFTKCLTAYVAVAANGCHSKHLQ